MTTATCATKEIKHGPLDWEEVYYTDCPLVSASNVDQELAGLKKSTRRSAFSISTFVLAPRTTGTRTTSTTSTT